MTLLEILNKGDRFAATSGIAIMEIRPGYCRAEMTVTEDHINAAGVCQGGALFTLADMAVAGVVNASGQVCLGINAQINYVHSAQLGERLKAECTLISDGKVPLVSVRISNPTGDIVAFMTSEGYKKKVPLTFEGLS
ncbi:MAG: hotdog fold thioesterase [Bacteroidaceae bacterium]|nr:hotdog fold thioesterase [Bacteroidaceae bacterium]